MTSTGNLAMDGLADAIADRIIEKTRAGQSKLMRMNEAAVYLGVSRRTLEGLIGTGKIPSVREGSLVRLDREDVGKWIEFRKSKA